MARQDVRERLAALEATCDQAEPEDVLKALRTALQARHRLLVARAAELTASRLLYDLEPDLREAFDRLRVDPLKRDAGCIAKGAIVRALVALDCLDAELYIAGIHYRQLEPVWGGRMDTAVDLRVSCAMGLVGTSHSRALMHLVDLLYDPEPRARGGAARAIACAEPFKRDQDRMLLRGAVLHRSEAAFAWLLEVVASGDLSSAEVVIDELATYRDTAQTRKSLHDALVTRDEPSLLARYRRAFPAREGAR